MNTSHLNALVIIRQQVRSMTSLSFKIESSITNRCFMISNYKVTEAFVREPYFLQTTTSPSKQSLATQMGYAQTQRQADNLGGHLGPASFKFVFKY